MPVNGDFTAVRVIKAHKKVYYCGFSGTGRADYCHILAVFYVQVKVFYKRFFLVVGKIDMLKFYIAENFFFAKGAGALRFFLAVKQGKNTLGGGNCTLKVAYRVRNIFKRSGNLLCKQNDSNYCADGNSSVKYQPSANQVYRNIGKRICKSYAGSYGRGNKSCFYFGVTLLYVDFLMPFYRCFLIIICLCGCVIGIGFLNY